MLDLDALYGFHEELAGGVRSPRVNSALTYLAEIECYHPDDDANSDNLIYWSEQLSETVWDSPETGAATVTTDATTDPNGGTTADILTFDGSLSGSGRYQDVNVDPSTEYTFSVYLKRLTSTVEDMLVRDMTGSSVINGTGGISGLSTGTWVRCSFTFTTPAGCRLMRIYPVWVATGTVAVWGCMLNTGATAGTYTKREGAPTRTLRFSSLPYTSQIDDVPAQTHYESRLLQPGLMRRDLFSPGQPGGQITVGYGLVEILNTGDLDEYTEASFDGRSYVLKVGRIDQPLRDFITVLKTTMEAADFTSNRMTLKLRDHLAVLDNPVTKKKYLGNGSSLEGDADLKDRFKPITFGVTNNTTPVLINAGLLIYQVSSAPLADLTVYEGGRQVSADAPYSSLADLLANAPSSGNVRVWLEGGLFRAGFYPTMALTCGSLAAGDTYKAGTCLQALAQAGGWTGTINAADVAALDAAAGVTVGYLIDNGGQALETMNAIAAGLGVWFGPDRLGELRMGMLAEPSGTPVMTLSNLNILSIEHNAPATLPAKQITLKYRRNWTPMQEFDGSVTEAARQLLRNQWQQIIADNTANATARKLAATLDYESAIQSITGGPYTAWRLMGLYGAPRDILQVRVRARPEDTLLLDLDDVVQVTYPRFGLTAGQLFRIIGIQADYRIGQLELTLWG